MGALEIPIGTYHRSESGKKGSIVLNQSTRDKNFDQKKEFLPVSVRSNKQLMKAREVNPVYWIWTAQKIKRIKIDSEVPSLKRKPNQLKSSIST